MLYVPSEARGDYCFGGWFQKAFRQYESAMGSAAATDDRLCQMEAMDGAARCLEALRLQHKICNCRPLEFNTRLLEVANSMGAKVSSEARIYIYIRPARRFFVFVLIFVRLVGHSS